MQTRRAFTITELLVVVAVLMLIAAILFPVFSSARSAARKAVCISNNRQAYLATMLYLSDYDDRFMPVSHQPEELQNSRSDRTWVQLILPYTSGNFNIFHCPEDTNPRPRLEATFEDDLIPGDTYSQYYRASQRSNIGFNFVYFSPIFSIGDEWQSLPKPYNYISEPAKTLMFLDSVWQRDADGSPSGGGSWLVIPPCRYERVGGDVRDTFTPNNARGQVFTAGREGWELQIPVSSLQYGGAWPWHNGHVTVIRADGSATMMNPLQLARGCDVKPNWEGLIQNSDEYLWDFQ